ncbi:rifin PIR protein,putative [Plasmodium sp. DRC-Itaito]|nr:rifin PIR protein,putative [Plasmodium sp. DRC-Itaito]
MKVHYINILLFAHALNILVNTHKNEPHTSPHHKPTTRLLCECELYAPANYDSDPQMKEVMDNFNKQTQERFHEYDERLQSKRKQCKDKCDKEIQKIILKDKLEKELMDKFSTLDTDIQSDAIPTCICEKSLADKVEKGCLRCGGVLGGGVAPGVGILGGMGIHAWKLGALATATKYATAKGLALGKIYGELKGKVEVMEQLGAFYVEELFPKIFQTFDTTSRYTEVTTLTNSILEKYGTIRNSMDPKVAKYFPRFQHLLRTYVENGGTEGTDPSNAIPKWLNFILEEATEKAKVAEAAAKVEAANAIEVQQTNVINTICGSWETTIIAAVVAIVIIVLVMLIIYLILRRRRKKKMKKKVQYIKLLEE